MLLLHCSGTTGGVLEGEVEEPVPRHREFGQELPWAHLENEDEKSCVLLEVLGLCSRMGPQQENHLQAAETITLSLLFLVIFHPLPLLREQTGQALLIFSKLNSIW